MIDFRNYKGTLTQLCKDIIADGLAEDRRSAEKVARAMVPSEGVYQAVLMQELKRRAKYGGLKIKQWKATQGLYSQGGVSDIIGTVGGVPIAVEVKRPVFGEVSKLQEKFLREFQEAGGEGCVAIWPEDLDEMWERVLRRSSPAKGMEVSHE